MKHLDEQTLELYVLGAAEVAARKGEIEDHLESCHGCRDLVAEMHSFYEEMHDLLEKLPPDEVKMESALARPRRIDRPLKELFTTTPARPVTTVQHIRYFVRRHPVIAAGGGMAGIGCVAALILFAVNSFRVDMNPARLFPNLATGTLQVYNKESRLLWEKQSSELTPVADVKTLENRTGILDLDGDGTHEVVTTLALMDGESVAETRFRTLRVISGQGVTVWEHSFSHPFQYLNRNFSTSFTASTFVKGDFHGNGHTNLIVAATNPRAPSRIVRLDPVGKEIGAYWHQGHLWVFGTFDQDADGFDEVIAGGRNDVHDTTMGEFPVLVILNPRAITSQGKSSTSPGFDFPTSTAELYYVRFPISDIRSGSNTSPTIHDVTVDDNGIMSVSSSSIILGKNICLEYVLDRTMRVLEVRSNVETDRFHQELKKQGRVTSTLDLAYLESLRESVRYWDGLEWRKEVITVNPPQLAERN